MIYFDNAATTGHKPQKVINSFDYAVKNLSVNPGRGGYNLSKIAANTVFNARKKVSDFFGSDGEETVVFTHNCTTAINYVLKGVLKQGDHVIISDIEHNAVMRPLNAMQIDYSLSEVSLFDDKQTIMNFENAIKPNTKMIFCTAASNVLGKILPIKEIGELCKKRDILFGVDAAQAAGVIPINMKEMNIDYLCIAAHKGLYCPMGLGILIARKPINKTIIEGGTGTESISFIQPDTLPERLESGTVNLPAIATVGAGIDFVKGYGDYLYKYENRLVKRLYNALRKEDVIFYTEPNYGEYVPVICFNINDVPSEKIAEVLGKRGFALRAGLHCAPNAHKKTGTLAQGAVRFSPSVFNNEYEVDMLIKNIKNLKKLKKHY